MSAPTVTVMVLLVPVTVVETVSVAVNVWLPVVFSVMPKVPTPLVSVLLGGTMAWPSVVVK